MSDPRLVTLVTDHDDTADLYRIALEHADFVVHHCASVDEAVNDSRSARPMSIVVHFSPRQDPAAIGSVLRAANPGTVLVGLFSIQLPLASLKRVLDHFDDVIMIPCAPEALLAHIIRIQERRQKQASA